MTKAGQNHYDVLGVKRNATNGEIKKAYKKAALRLHPDRNPAGESMFKRVSNAYEVLMSADTRRRYDGGLDGAFAAAAGTNFNPDASWFQQYAQQRGKGKGGPPPPDAPREQPFQRNYKNAQTTEAQDKLHEELLQRRKRQEAERKKHEENFSKQNINFSEWYKNMTADPPAAEPAPAAKKPSKKCTRTPPSPPLGSQQQTPAPAAAAASRQPSKKRTRTPASPSTPPLPRPAGTKKSHAQLPDPLVPPLHRQGSSKAHDGAAGLKSPVTSPFTPPIHRNQQSSKVPKQQQQQQGRGAKRQGSPPSPALARRGSKDRVSERKAAAAAASPLLPPGQQAQHSHHTAAGRARKPHTDPLQPAPSPALSHLSASGRGSPLHMSRYGSTSEPKRSRSEKRRQRDKSTPAAAKPTSPPLSSFSPPSPPPPPAAAADEAGDESWLKEAERRAESELRAVRSRAGRHRADGPDPSQTLRNNLRSERVRAAEAESKAASKRMADLQERQRADRGTAEHDRLRREQAEKREEAAHLQRLQSIQEAERARQRSLAELATKRKDEFKARVVEKEAAFGRRALEEQRRRAEVDELFMEREEQACDRERRMLEKLEQVRAAKREGRPIPPVRLTPLSNASTSPNLPPSPAMPHQP
ncbi:hypothetical protein DIPPA_02844 [Diplonema papillatum]|nr:hypothetical protein DIPPA_02844 [Diplonema papillatum]